jgi:predicted dehydrogenase
MTDRPVLPKVGVGVVGCGNISGVYLEVCRRFPILEVVACADLELERAAAKAEKYQIPQVLEVADLLAEPAVEIVLNLTPPKAHSEIGLAAINAGKSVYNEKPLAVQREDGWSMLAAAKSRGRRVGCAPDTVLGGGLQTCRALIDSGAIGAPIAATAFMLNHGHESWHPAPEFYYQEGGGPLFDMGPYYLTALIHLMGPVRRVTGSARISFPERTITSQPLAGRTIRVETPTHIAGVLEFASGSIGTLVTSFDVWDAQVPLIEIYGAEGTLGVPDPNRFDGPAWLRLAGAGEWSPVALTHGYTQNSRGIGVADMAYGMRSGRAHRANGEVAYHVLDIIHAIQEAALEGRHIELKSTCQRPAPLPAGFPEYELDE